MSEAKNLRRSARLRPWIALLLPPVAWYGFQVGLGSVLKVDCQSAGGWLGLTWGFASLALCGGAALIARPLARTGAGDRSPPRAWLAWIAMLLSGVFALAIVFQTLSVLIVPSCIG